MRRILAIGDFSLTFLLSLSSSFFMEEKVDYDQPGEDEITFIGSQSISELINPARVNCTRLEHWHGSLTA